MQKLQLLLERTENYFETVPFIIYSHLNVSWKDSNVQSLINENNVTIQVVIVKGFNPESGNVRTTLAYVTDSTEN